MEIARILEKESKRYKKRKRLKDVFVKETTEINRLPKNKKKVIEKSQKYEQE